MVAKTNLLRNARREVAIVVVINVLALIWTVGYCYLFGYQHAANSWVVEQGLATSRTGQDLQQIGGLPDWVLVGIFLPWLLCTVFTIGICMGIEDDDLGSEADEPQEAGHAGH